MIFFLEIRTRVDQHNVTVSLAYGHGIKVYAVWRIGISSAVIFCGRDDSFIVEILSFGVHAFAGDEYVLFMCRKI